MSKDKPFVPNSIYVEEQPNGNYVIVWQNEFGYFTYGTLTFEGKWVIDD